MKGILQKLKPRVAVMATAILSLLSGCTGSDHDSRLAKVSEIVSESPREALSCLDSIDYNNLSKADRHYYDFLKVKACDKAYITHTTDSLILSVVDYYSSHKRSGLYPEALYYAGRVYHDMGDFPTSLKFYQNALDLADINNNDIYLRGCILSQISSILNSLRLYRKAIPYLHEALVIDSINSDTNNTLFDLEKLGVIYLNLNEIDTAKSIFVKGLSLARDSFMPDTATFNLYLGIVSFNKGIFDESLKLIKPSIANVDSTLYDMALRFISQLYQQKEIPDSALKYAYELIHSKIPENRKTGYQILLSDKIIQKVPHDSIAGYVSGYSVLINNYLNKNGDRSALIQDSFYNYQIHEREKNKAEDESHKLRNVLCLSLIITMLLCITILYLRYKNKSQRLILYDSIVKVNRLRHSINQTSGGNNTSLMTEELEMRVCSNEEEFSSLGITDLRTRLRSELFALQTEGNNEFLIPPIILKSDAYECVLRHINADHIVSDNDILWAEMEKTVNECSPNFRQRLNVLTHGKISNSEFQVALLIKCGISTSDISRLVGRAKSTIVY